MRTLLPSRSLRSLSTLRLSALLATIGVLAACPDFALAGPEPPPIGPNAPAALTLQDIIAEASRRFGLPASWIAEIIAVESRGRANALSPKGAIGLMQVMPQTYADMRARHGLGVNPWDPRDNVLAGAAYLRLLFDRYGAQGFLVAYNAGPGRWDDYRLRGRSLPPETVAYLARLGPVVGGSVLPVPTFAAEEVPRSPLASPLFVRLASVATSMQTAADPERIVRIIDANASFVGRTDSVFVARQRAADVLPDRRSGDRHDPDESPTGSTPTASSPQSEPPRSALFPLRTGAGPQQ